MNEVKRVTSSGLSSVFGLAADSDSFLFKPANSLYHTYPEPHRKELYSLGLLVQGAADFRVGLDSYAVQAPGLIAISPDEVRQWRLLQTGSKITSLFFTEEFAVSGLADSQFVKRLSIYQKTGQHFIQLTLAEVSSLLALFQQLEKKQQSMDLHKRESMQAMLRVLLLEVLNVAAIQAPYEAATYSQAQHLTRRFKQLLTERVAQHRAVGYYAEHLFSSPKHLSQTLKEQTGKTARELIEELVCLEAKVLLQVEEFTISQVAQQLHFANPSFFGKFFKRHAGLSPQQYRHQLTSA